MDKLLGGGHFYEGPRWHDGHWYVSDLYAGHVLRVATDGVAEEVVAIDDQPSGTGWMPDGSMLIVAMREQLVLRRARDGELSEHAALGALVVDLVNDMVVDSEGGAYVGSFGFDLFGGGQPVPGNIVRVEPDGSTSVAADDLRFPNGMVITPDGGTLVVAESFGARFTAFDIGSDGALDNRRVWAQVSTTPSYDSFAEMLQTDFAPDGCAMDAEGLVWVADALGARACRVAEGGEIVEQVPAPDGHGLYSVTLGGVDGRTLLACCAPSFADTERKAAKEAELFTHRVDVPHGGGRP